MNKYVARLRGGEHFVSYLRKQGMVIGKGARIFSDISTSESYLIHIGDHTTISNNVQFITHDASIQKAIPQASDLFGRIEIGNNCFIGARSIIMYGVTLPDNTIVAAGSVVTKSISAKGQILGGNPAKIIGTMEELAEKYKNFAINISGLTAEEKKQALTNEKILVKK